MGRHIRDDIAFDIPGSNVDRYLVLQAVVFLDRSFILPDGCWIFPVSKDVDTFSSTRKKLWVRAGVVVAKLCNAENG